jgi:hypothetical protein
MDPTRFFHVDPNYVLAAVAVTSNGPHLSGTWSRVYLDTRELRRRPFAFVGVPLLITAAIVAMVQTTPEAHRITTSIILYWATWHFAAQCYGLLRIYQRKSGEPARPGHRAEALFVFATAAAGILWRIHYGPRSLFGITAITPPVPFAVVALALTAWIGSGLAVLVDQTRRALAGHAIPWPRLAFLGAVLLGFGVPFMLMTDGTAGFAAAACWHGLQYLGIVYHYNRQKFRSGDARGAGLIAWVSQPGRQFVYVALMLGMVGVVYGGIFAVAQVTHWDLWKLTLSTWTSITLSHYWLDGLIWKMRHAENRRVLAA